MYRNIGKITIFKGTKKNILHFDGSNNIFADYICILYKQINSYENRPDSGEYRGGRGDSIMHVNPLVIFSDSLNHSTNTKELFIIGV